MYLIGAGSLFLPDCEKCRLFFYNKCELHGPPLFIPDSAVPMRVVDRARRSLPADLKFKESALPNAAYGVFNTGQTLPVCAHFGAYQQDMVEKEQAIKSIFSCGDMKNNRLDCFCPTKLCALLFSYWCHLMLLNSLVVYVQIYRCKQGECYIDAKRDTQQLDEVRTRKRTLLSIAI